MIIIQSSLVIQDYSRFRYKRKSSIAMATQSRQEQKPRRSPLITPINATASAGRTSKASWSITTEINELTSQSVASREEAQWQKQSKYRSSELDRTKKSRKPPTERRERHPLSELCASLRLERVGAALSRCI